MSLGLKLCLDDLQLALAVIELFTEALQFLLLLFNLESMAAFYVLLDLHPHDVSIYW